ncbi:MAG: tetratricopeptide repeat protein, partial [Candidatus Promineifilaceae bacterium]
PAKMRRGVIQQFCGLSSASKKATIKVAVVGDPQPCLSLNLVDAGDLPEHIEATIDLLRLMLHSSTVRRLSARFGPLAERAEQQGVATNLYIQAGMLEEAERCALQHATTLMNQNANDDALRCIRSVVDFASMKGDLFKVRELLMLRGDLYKSLGETEKALQTYENIIAVYKNHDPDKILAETYKDLGDVYRKREDFANGLKVLDKALRIYTGLNDQLEISHTLNNVGNLHSLNGDVKKALQTYQQAFAIQRRLDAKQEAASTLMNMGVMYYSSGRYNRCIKLTEISLKMKREVGNLAEIALSLNNLGYVHHVIGQQAKAVDYLHQALEVNRKIGSKKEILYNLENLSEVMIDAGQLDKSLSFLKEGLELAESLDDKPHSSAFHFSVAIVYMRMGRIAEAEAELQRGEYLAGEISYRHMVLFASLQRAWIRQFLGDSEGALAITCDVLEKARESNDIKNQSGALHLLTRLSNDESTLEKLREVQETADHSGRQVLLSANRVEYLLDHGQIDEAVSAASSIDEATLLAFEGIESSRACVLFAETMIAQSRFDDAAPLLARAVRMARANGLRPEWATALTLQGQAAFHEGNYERSYALYKEALGLWKAIAGSINSEDDRLIFLKRRSIVFLTNEIRRLSSIFAKKKGQTDACPSHEV